MSNSQQVVDDLVDKIERLKRTHDWDHRKVIMIMAAYSRVVDFELARQVFKKCELPCDAIEPIRTLSLMAEANTLETRRVGEYSLPRTQREELHARYERILAGENAEPEPELADASQQLTQLIASLPDGRQRSFCDEALLCSRLGAYRSSIVMAWNFAIDHLINWIVAEQSRIDRFNDVLTDEWLNKAKQVKKPAIANGDELGELKEFDVIRIARTSDLIDKTTINILKPALERRNDAAHPFNSRTFHATTAASHLTELVQIVVDRPIR